MASNLSPWRQAVLAAAAGDAKALAPLLQKSQPLREQRLSAADCAFFEASYSLHFAAGKLLVELALERDHEGVVLLLLPPADGLATPPLLSQQSSPSFDARDVISSASGVVGTEGNEHLLRRAVSEVSPAVLAEMLRDHLAKCLEVPDPVAGAGLRRLAMPPGERHTFFLPRELSSLEPVEQRRALGLLTEAADVLPQIEAAVGWWNGMIQAALQAARCDTSGEYIDAGLNALYTSADGNCLLHAVLLCAVGIRDRRIARPGIDAGASAADDPRPRRLIRAAVHAALRWPPLVALLASHGADLAALEARTASHGHSLEAPHLLVLAHLFGRPIVCYCAAELEYRDQSMDPSTAASGGMRVSGLYLPFLIPPARCASRDPLVVAYTRGHFSALVATEAVASDATWAAMGMHAPAGTPSIPIPLADEHTRVLPIMFPPSERAYPAADADALVAALAAHGYCESAVTWAGHPGRPRIPVVAQRCPPRAIGPSGAPADAYFNADWRQRVAALSIAGPLI